MNNTGILFIIIAILVDFHDSDVLLLNIAEVKTTCNLFVTMRLSTLPEILYIFNNYKTKQDSNWEWGTTNNWVRS